MNHGPADREADSAQALGRSQSGRRAERHYVGKGLGNIGAIAGCARSGLRHDTDRHIGRGIRGHAAQAPAQLAMPGRLLPGFTLEYTEAIILSRRTCRHVLFLLKMIRL